MTSASGSSTVLQAGSNASRNQSPMKFATNETAKVAMPGIVISHHAIVMKVRPPATIAPPGSRPVSNADTEETERSFD